VCERLDSLRFGKPALLAGIRIASAIQIPQMFQQVPKLGIVRVSVIVGKRTAQSARNILPDESIPSPRIAAKNKTDAMRYEDSSPERRHQMRAPVRWVVYLRRPLEAPPVKSETVNLSSGGFYCQVSEPFEPGERIDCDILVPQPRGAAADNAIVLKCRAQVLRVEVFRGDTGPEEVYGLGCRIEDYAAGTVGPSELTFSEYQNSGSGVM
jgi:PilZ domain